MSQYYCPSQNWCLELVLGKPIEHPIFDGFLQAIPSTNPFNTFQIISIPYLLIDFQILLDITCRGPQIDRNLFQICFHDVKKMPIRSMDFAPFPFFGYIGSFMLRFCSHAPQSCVRDRWDLELPTCHCNLFCLVAKSSNLSWDHGKIHPIDQDHLRGRNCYTHFLGEGI